MSQSKRSNDTAQILEQKIEKLALEGLAVLGPAGSKTLPPFSVTQYEAWYSNAIVMLNSLLPDRLNEFKALYRAARPAKLTSHTFTISDYYRGAWIDKGDVLAAIKIYNQVAILRAAKTRIQSTLTDLTDHFRDQVLEQELDSARILLKAKHYRASGAVAGVVLERHLASVCAARNMTPSKKNPTLNDFSMDLKTGGVLDTVAWKHVDYLGGLRNLCCHPKDREPTATDAQELIDGVDKVMKTLA